MDLDKIRKIHEKVTNNTPAQRNMWKPDLGDHIIRIVPYVHQQDNPFVELYFHYRLLGKTYMSPIVNGDADPFVEQSELLTSHGDRDKWIFGKKLEPKVRYFAPVIVRGEEKQGVRFWGFPQTIYKELLSYAVDPDYGDYTDLKTGRDITVSVTKEAGKKWNNTSIKLKPNTSVATSDKDMLQKIKEVPDVKTFFEVPTYEMLKKALVFKLENGHDAEQSDTNGATSGVSSKDSEIKEKVKETFSAEKKAPAKTTAVDDINDEFAGLFDDDDD